MTLTPMVQCTFRLAFAFLLANQALSTLVVPSIAAEASTGTTQFRAPIETAQFIAVNALLIVIAIWVAFGIRTRLVSAIGLTLYTGYTLASGSYEADNLGIGIFVALGLALPLIVAGGGAYAMYRKGWSGLADL
ncbi:MAG: hypothetical protein JXQ91_03330 [Vannielia sp.]|uniref:hypothetical protein n=1 Tax=Rhodobacterales TaxID=204455 RepID=UPI0020961B0F|nr:hypothetical protein [Oceanicola sp. 502str15]MCO6382039.1 hypothetical protein [Oceanicola sp. 502str15]